MSLDECTVREAAVARGPLRGAGAGPSTIVHVLASVGRNLAQSCLDGLPVARIDCLKHFNMVDPRGALHKAHDKESVHCLGAVAVKSAPCGLSG
jgi:hypothetical protein